MHKGVCTCGYAYAIGVRACTRARVCFCRRLRKGLALNDPHAPWEQFKGVLPPSTLLFSRVSEPVTLPC